VFVVQKMADGGIKKLKGLGSDSAWVKKEDIQIISALLCFCKNVGVVFWDKWRYLLLDFASFAVLVWDERVVWLRCTVSMRQCVHRSE